MDDRTCVKCGKKFKYPSQLKSHLSRKTPCEIVFRKISGGPEGKSYTHNCDFCGRALASAYSKQRHIKQYCKIVQTAKKNTDGLREIYSHIKKEATISQLEEQNKRLMEMVSSLASNTKTARSSVTKVMNVETLKAKVYINGAVLYFHSFGREDLSHLTREYVEALLRENARQSNVVEGAHQVMFEMAQTIYSNPDVPQNLTSFAPNVKYPDILVLFDQTGWTRESKKTLCLPMITRILDELFHLQPHHRASELGDLMKELNVYEKKHLGTFSRKVDVLFRRNRDLIMEMRGALPKPGEKEKILPASKPTYLPALENKE